MAATVSKSALLKILGDTADADEKLAAVTARADKLREDHPELTVRVNTAEASAKLAILKAELKDVTAGSEAGSLEAAGVSATELGGKLGALSNYTMPALIGSLAALSPVLITAGAGLGVFGLAAVEDLKGSSQL